MGTRRNLEIPVPVSIKAEDPFMWIRKKIGPMVNLEATRQTVLAITDSGEEEGSLPEKEGEGC